MTGKPIPLVSAIAPSKLEEKLGTTCLVLLSFAILVLGCWSIANRLWDNLYLSYGILAGILSVNYGILFFANGSLRWPGLAIFGAMFVVSLSTPSILETDQFRYVWDGLVAQQGDNPFRLAPSDRLEYNSIWWAERINHAHLPTIYPPAAQWLFHLSTYVNPFFWNLIWGLDFLPVPTSLYQVELGWKVIVALGCGTIGFCLRKKRWELILCHPLFLLQFVANGHVDGFLVLLLLGLVSTWSSSFRFAALAGAILTKIYPIIYLPFVIVKWRRSSSLKVNLSLTVLTVLGAFLYFSRGAEGNLFSSFITFGKHWFFFGYLHQWATDFFGLFTANHIGIFASKVLGAILGGLLAVNLLYQLHLGKISFRLGLLVVTMGFWAVSPTLHPWYLLAILPLALPYRKIFWSPFIWPVLGLTSITFYIDNQDPSFLRNTVYAIITITALIDIAGYKKHRLRKRRM